MKGKRKKGEDPNREVERALAEGNFLFHIRKIRDGDKIRLQLTIPEREAGDDVLGSGKRHNQTKSSEK